MAALIPGLKGVYNEQRQVLATKINFEGDDLEELQAQREALEKQQAQLIEQQKQIEANKAAIAANTAWFGQLDDYYIWDEVTVYFGNGQVIVDPKYEAPLLALG